jgi:hypothetical protein
MTDDDLDQRVERALREAAPLRGAGPDVFEQIAVKRARRRQRRLAGRAVATLAVATVVVTGALVALDGQEPAHEIATARRPRVVEHATPRLDAGRALVLEPLEITPDSGYVRPPVLPSGDTVAVSAYDRTDGGFTVPPSRIVRVESSDGRIRDRVDLEGEIVALADGEGARWALTRDQVVDGPTDARFRVKRIAGDGTVASNPVPPGEEPSGTIAAGGGAVWVPVRDGVLRYDLTTGAFAAKVPLAPAERRAVAVGGKAAYVSDGAAVLRLDPTSSAAALAGARPPATPVLGLTSSARTPLVELLGPDVTGEASVADAFGDRTVQLPANVDASGLRSANGVVWVDATIDGTVVAILLDEALRGVERVVRLPATSDATLTFLARDRVLVVSGGQMWTAALGPQR